MLFTQQISMNALPILTTVTRGVKTRLVHLNVPVEMDMFYLVMEGPARMLTSVQLIHILASSCASTLMEDLDVTAIQDFNST